MEVLRFALLGLGLGALYALASQGLLVIYRGSGVLNFAHGAIGMVGAYVALGDAGRARPADSGGLGGRRRGVRRSSAPPPTCWSCASCSAPRRWPASSPRSACSSLQSAAVLRYGVAGSRSSSPSCRPNLLHIRRHHHLRRPLHPAGHRRRADARPVGPLPLHPLRHGDHRRRREPAGGVVARACRPTASPRSTGRSARRWPASPRILIAPIVQLQVAAMTNLVLAALAAALVAGFRRFPLAFVGGLILGIGQTEARPATSHARASPSSLPFIVIVVWMIMRGQALPLRDYFLQRLPCGRERADPAARRGRRRSRSRRSSSSWCRCQWQDAFVTTFAIGDHPALGRRHHRLRRAAVPRAVRAGRVRGAGRRPPRRRRRLAVPGSPLLAGVVATVPLGALFALPAVRSRGINLAIVTLGLGTAIELMVFNNVDFVGGFAGTDVGRPSLFGLDINAISHPEPLRASCAWSSSCSWPWSSPTCGAAAPGGACSPCAPTSGPPRRSASASPAPRCTPSPSRPASPRSAASLLAFRTDVILYGNVFPNFTVDPRRRRTRSSAASASCSARCSARPWRRARSARQISNAIFAEHRRSTSSSSAASC